jgi:hypothetical protein
MSEPHAGWPAARTVHLAGGCRAFNDFNPAVELFPRLTDGEIMTFDSRQYGDLYAELASLDIAPIGCEFISNALEAKGLLPTTWRPYQPWTPEQVWPCNNEMDRWAQFAHAAFESSDTELWDIARRVSHQLRVCAWRLYELSEAYKAQLQACTAEGDFEPGTGFVNGFTWLGYLAVQVFLIDACILRDYLAEFYAAHACPDALKAEHRITSMANLYKEILKKKSSSNPLFLDLRSAASPGGWLYVLGDYRDLVVHCVPLARADLKLQALTTMLQVKGAKPLPSVSLPLPNDPSRIRAARASSARSEWLAREFELLSSATSGESPSTDALEYCCATLDHLTRLAARIGYYSPVSPKIPRLTREDLIGEIAFRTR